jgi:hypothetical protein
MDPDNTIGPVLPLVAQDGPADRLAREIDLHSLDLLIVLHANVTVTRSSLPMRLADGRGSAIAHWCRLAAHQMNDLVEADSDEQDQDREHERQQSASQRHQHQCDQHEANQSPMSGMAHHGTSLLGRRRPAGTGLRRL